MAKRKKPKKKGQKKHAEPRKCGLCGKTARLTKTECCGQWICDDEDQYVPFSYARNSCHRNHRRYTLCGYHHVEGHPGDWKTCPECREAFETEMYVYYGINEYNFEKLENPPEYEPTRCAKCNAVIVLGEGGYSSKGGEYFCAKCSDFDWSRFLGHLNEPQRGSLRANREGTPAVGAGHRSFEGSAIGKGVDLNIGDSVVVKSGVKDPDLGIDIAGWQGRISAIEGSVVCINWDSLTLAQMPSWIVARCEEEGLEWGEMYLETREVERAAPRDTEKDVARMIEKLEKEHAWDYLGEEGKRIGALLAGVDPDDEWAVMTAWGKHLRKSLKFPFEAEVAEPQERGPLRSGDRVVVERIEDIDDHYGVIVEIRHGPEVYDFPLCDLEVTEKGTTNYPLVKDYIVWFANR